MDLHTAGHRQGVVAAPHHAAVEAGRATLAAGGKALEWRRDPVNVYAFHVDVPTGTRALDLTFRFVSPTQTNQGRIVATREMLNLQWEAVLLYPAGYYSSRIRVVSSVKLPKDWRFAAALDGAATNGDTTRFAETDLETLVDSPLFAGKHYRLVELDRGAERPTRLNLFADRPDQLAAKGTILHAQLIPFIDLRIAHAFRTFPFVIPMFMH